MWNKIKAWPTTVQVSVVFLTVIWCALLVAVPPVFITLTVIALVIASVVRVGVYFMGDM